MIDVYCPKCGYLMTDLDVDCPRCAKLAKQVEDAKQAPQAAPRTGPAGPHPSAVAAQGAARAAGSTIKEASRSAFSSFLVWATDPVGGLPKAYSSISPRQALLSGVVFAVACAVCVTMAVMHFDQAMSALAGSHGAGSADPVQIGLWGYIKVFLSGLVPFAAFAVVGWLVRLPAKTGTTGGDFFTAGAAVLPLGLTALIGSFILTSITSEGAAQRAVAMFLIVDVFGFCYATLILFSGATRISLLSERAAALVVPLMWLLGGWLTAMLLSVLWPGHGSGSSVMEKLFSAM